jgi:hypothetical protein
MLFVGNIDVADGPVTHLADRIQVFLHDGAQARLITQGEGDCMQQFYFGRTLLQLFVLLLQLLIG